MRGDAAQGAREGAMLQPWCLARWGACRVWSIGETPPQDLSKGGPPVRELECTDCFGLQRVDEQPLTPEQPRKPSPVPSRP